MQNTGSQDHHLQEERAAEVYFDAEDDFHDDDGSARDVDECEGEEERPRETPRIHKEQMRHSQVVASAIKRRMAQS